MLPSFPQVLEYLHKSPLEIIDQDLSEGKSDPNDLISYGNFLFMEIQQMGPDAGTQMGLTAKAELLTRGGVEAIEHNPTKLASNIDLGMAYWQWAALLIALGKGKESHAVLQRAVVHGHATAQIRELLAQFPKQPTESDEAGMAFNNLRQLHEKAAALYRAERWKEAAREYDVVVKGLEDLMERHRSKFPDIETVYSGALTDLAICLLEGGDISERTRPAVTPAAKLAIKALSITPGDQAAEKALGFCVDWVLNMLESSFVQVADFPQFGVWKDYCDEGYTCLKEKKFDGAVHCYGSAISIRPETDFAWHGLGLALVALGKTGEAVAAFEKLYALSPEYIFLFRNKAQLRSSAQAQDERPSSSVSPSASKKGFFSKLFGA